MNYLLSLGRYEIVSFMTGFALLSYELAGARILAPSIGTSTYVWTSVIGIIIAALSLGYWAGGALADKRNRQMDIVWLLFFSAALVVLTLVMSDIVLKMVSTKIDDPRMQGLASSLLLFAPASFLLGSISPYLVKLRVRSLETTGRSVASLSALNSIGGIIGTFATGFLFFGYIGSREILVLLAIILVAVSWFLNARENFLKRLFTTFILITVSLMFWLPTKVSGVVLTIDTADATYQILDVNYLGAPVRVLTMGPGGYQSGVFKNGRKELVFGYSRKIAEIIDTIEQKDSMLILGGGSFTMPEYFARKYPEMSIDIVEIDPELEKIAEEFFNYTSLPNISVINRDARAFLNNNAKLYDLIVVDVFSDISTPFTLTTKQYVERLGASLKPEGVVLVNVIGSASENCKTLLAGLHSTYRKTFPHAAVFPLKAYDLMAYQNIILAYSKEELDLDKVLGQSSVELSSDLVFTDSFAPIERLHHQCASA